MPLLLLAALLAQAARQPVPDAAQQKQALATVKESFKAEYASPKPKDRLNLAKKLILNAKVSSHEPHVQYVLYREARDIATDGGDGETALAAIDGLAAAFDVDGLTMKVTTLATIGRRALAFDEVSAFSLLALKVCDEAVAIESFDAAALVLIAPANQAKRVKDTALAANVAARQKRVADLKARLDSVRKAQETLQTKPDDEEANLIVGQYLCFAKERWDEGLPLLQKGSDALLRDLIVKENAPVLDPIEKAQIGDAWWDRSEKAEETPAKNALRRRAIHWYEGCIDTLSGWDRKKVEQRIVSWRRQLGRGWENVSTPALWGLAEGPMKVEAASGPRRIALAKMPLGEFDAIRVSFRGVGVQKTARVGIVLEDDTFCAAIGKAGLFVARRATPEAAWVSDGVVAEFLGRDVRVFEVAVAGGQYQISVDGKVLLTRPSAEKTITMAAIDVQDQTAVIEEVKLRYKR